MFHFEGSFQQNYLRKKVELDLKRIQKKNQSNRNHKFLGREGERGGGGNL